MINPGASDMSSMASENRLPEFPPINSVNEFGATSREINSNEKHQTEICDIDYTTYHMLNTPSLFIRSNREVGGIGCNDRKEILQLSSSNGDPNCNNRSKRKLHRHTQCQIQQLETFYRECAHPDDKQRKELSNELGLTSSQIKFWFQNKRTQMKAQYDRHENQMLKAEHEELQKEQCRLKDALNNIKCLTCRGDTSLGKGSSMDQHLTLENARLKDELNRISAILTNYVGNSMYLSAEHRIIVELANNALEELIQMGHIGEPLWTKDANGIDILNENEYRTNFFKGDGPKIQGLTTEISRESGVVMMNHNTIVEILMNEEQWSKVFCGIVSRASTVEVIYSQGSGSYDGAAKVMTAEFQIPSPMVQPRDSYFVRYCKQIGPGSWAVVDVSLDTLMPNPTLRYKRRPSGCCIQEMPNGYSKVTWVEHVEAADDGSVGALYKPLIKSGLAFGAKRWLAILQRQSDRLATLKATDISSSDQSSYRNPVGEKRMLQLADQMTMSFCSGVGASTAHDWTMLTWSDADDDVRVMARNSKDEPNRTPGTVLSAATSFWLGHSPDKVLEFLCTERDKWDILIKVTSLQEVAQVITGCDTRNCVSLFRIITTAETSSSAENQLLMLQETFTDATGSYMIYAPVDSSMIHIFSENADECPVNLLPSGFAVLPDGLNSHPGGSLVTVAFQILVDTNPSDIVDVKSVSTVKSAIRSTVDKIKNWMRC